MRLAREAHTSRPWRIHEIAGDFEVEDVWALPTPGGPHDFPHLVELMGSFGPPRGTVAAPVRLLFELRWRLGELLGWDGEDDGLGARVPSLRERLPPDLRDTPPPDPGDLPFSPLYETDDEWAAEIANKTVHGVLHVGWVEDDDGTYRGQMAVLVKPNGLLGTAYMAAITPFRYLLVYPVLLRELGRRWRERVPA